MKDFYQISDNKLLRKPTYESIKRVHGSVINKSGSNGHARKYKINGINGADIYTRSPWKTYVTSFMVLTALLMGGATYYKHEGFNQAYAAKKERVIMLTPTPTPFVANFKDVRVKKVFEHLSSFNSPLAQYSEYIVLMADKYALDYTLVPAISFQESTLGKHNAGNFNAWGITTGKKTGPRFASYRSWEEGIEAATKLLAENYKVRMNKGIQEVYCPSSECSDKWVKNVTKFQEDINE